MAENKDNFILPNSQRFVELDSASAFKNLTKEEKLYAHYLSQVIIKIGRSILKRGECVVGTDRLIILKHF